MIPHAPAPFTAEESPQERWATKTAGASRDEGLNPTARTPEQLGLENK